MNTVSTSSEQQLDIKPAARRQYLAYQIPWKNVAFSGIGLIAAVAGFFFWQHVSSFQETDDAYITAHITPVSSRIESNVEQVLIDDNQHVKKGQLLLVLDARDFQKQANQSATQLERVRKESLVANSNILLSAVKSEASKLNAQGDLSGSDSEIARSTAAIREAEFGLEEQQQVLKQKQAELTRAELDYQRFVQLEAQGAISTSQRDSARRDFDVAKSTVDATTRAIQQKRELVDEAKHQLKIASSKRVQAQGNEKTAQASEIQIDVTRLQDGVSTASIKESDAKLQSDLLQLSYTRIYAPVSGRIGRKSVEVGQRVLPGARLFTITEDDIWVVANYKESQLEKMQIGQTVEIKVDILPHEKFEGVVESFSPGTGAQFTLLPPDNATGNFTKIVQRLPVKILFKGSVAKFHDKLAPGLSAIVSTNIK